MENTNREYINNAIDMMKYYKEKMTEEVGITVERDSLHPFPTEQLKKQLREQRSKETKEKLYAYGYGMNAHKYFEHFKKAVQDRLQKELEEQLKTKKMKTKKFYHTFDFKGREITLLLHIQEGSTGHLAVANATSTLKLTYSARLHEDEEVDGLTQKILLGRLEKGKLLEEFVTSTRFGFKLAYLKGLAYCFENEIKNGRLEIVGITNGIAKDKKAALEQSSQEVNANLEQ